MDSAGDDDRRGGIGDTIAIVEALVSRRRSWGVRELAEHIGVGRSSVHRTLNGLVSVGLAQQDEHAQYLVGARLRVLARAMHRSHPLLRLGGDALDALRDELGATVFVSAAALSEEASTVLMVREADSSVRYSIAPGVVLPLHAEASGLAILAVRGTHGLPTRLDAFTADSFRSRAELEAAVAEARERGGAISAGRHVPGAVGAAVAFAMGDSIVSVAVSGPESRLDEAQAEAALGRLSDSAESLRREVAEAVAREPRAAGSAGRSASTSVERLERLLTYLAGTPFSRATPRALARAIGTGTAATASLLASAHRAGLVAESGGGMIGPGMLLLRWAAIVGAGARDEDLVADELRLLAEAVGETVGYIEFDGREARVVRNAPGQGFIRYVPGDGVDVPLHAGASGKAILAHVPELLDSLAREALTERTLTDPGALRAELARIRDRGWALGEGERFPEAYGIAAPFFIDGAVAGSVTVTMPRHRVDPAASDSIASAVVTTTRRISALLSTD